MAYVKKNIVTEGLSGKLGNTIVFRQRGGKTIVSTTPRKVEREPSEAQKEHHQRFRAATKYAKQAIEDEHLREAYQLRAKEGQNAFNVAMADFMHQPNISELDLEAYDGRRGQQVVIKAQDDHMVAEVQVSIFLQNGELLEEGYAHLDDNGSDWVYTTQRANDQPSGSKLVVKASDLAGNEAEAEGSVI
ncbi:MAG: hypothetical protein ACFB15_14980 [Cyclobacteriaceae bacterium]